MINLIILWSSIFPVIAMLEATCDFICLFARSFIPTQNLTSCGQVAVKTEQDWGQAYSMLKHEGEMLVQLQGSPGISKVFWIGSRELAGQVSCPLHGMLHTNWLWVGSAFWLCGLFANHKGLIGPKRAVYLMGDVCVRK